MDEWLLERSAWNGRITQVEREQQENSFAAAQCTTMVGTFPDPWLPGLGTTDLGGTWRESQLP